MKKVLYIFLFMFVFLPVAGFVFLIIDEEEEIAERKEKEKSPEGRFQLKIEDFEERHKRLASLPPRSADIGGTLANYPDDYYDETQQLYKEEIAFNLEQFGEEATAKVVFLISQIPVTGQYFIGEIKEDACSGGLRDESAHAEEPQVFDAVCAQIAHRSINTICDYALGLAIGYGYKQMAQSIIRCYKPDIVITKTIDSPCYLGSDDDVFTVSTTHQSRDNAKARIADL